MSCLILRPIRLLSKSVYDRMCLKSKLCSKQQIFKNSMTSWAIIRGFEHSEMQCPGKRCYTQETTENKSTIDKDEVDRFSELCNNWWNEAGDLKALHTLNHLRVPLIRDRLLRNTVGQTKIKPLDGLKILDVGCGGGLLTEPLARLGAQVTGIDASAENIETAIWHAKFDPYVESNTSYIAKPVEELVDEKYESYDGVVASEIIEHVSDANTFVEACCNLVKPGGSLFFTTLNKTWLSWALAVVAAERLGIVPLGSHDWNKFLTPLELSSILDNNNMNVCLLHGMTMNPLTLRWQWISDTSINYALHAVKNKDTSGYSSDSESSSSSDSE